MADGGAEIGADREQRARHRIGGEGTAGQDRAERRADQKPFSPDFGPSDRDTFSCGNISAMKAPSRQPASTRGRMPPNSQRSWVRISSDAVDAVAPVDQRRADRDQHADHDHRPADRLADASGRGSLSAVVGGRRVFYGEF